MHAFKYARNHAINVKFSNNIESAIKNYAFCILKYQLLEIGKFASNVVQFNTMNTNQKKVGKLRNRKSERIPNSLKTVRMINVALKTC